MVSQFSKEVTMIPPTDVKIREIVADTTEHTLAPDAGESPAQQALFTPEAGSAAGKLPTPTPRR